jgi:hypothetical protein
MREGPAQQAFSLLRPRKIRDPDHNPMVEFRRLVPNRLKPGFDHPDYRFRSLRLHIVRFVFQISFREVQWGH